MHMWLGVFAWCSVLSTVQSEPRYDVLDNMDEMIRSVNYHLRSNGYHLIKMNELATGGDFSTLRLAGDPTMNTTHDKFRDQITYTLEIPMSVADLSINWDFKLDAVGASLLNIEDHNNRITSSNNAFHVKLVVELDGNIGSCFVFIKDISLERLRGIDVHLTPIHRLFALSYPIRLLGTWLLLHWNFEWFNEWLQGVKLRVGHSDELSDLLCKWFVD